MKITTLCISLILACFFNIEKTFSQNIKIQESLDSISQMLQGEDVSISLDGNNLIIQLKDDEYAPVRIISLLGVSKIKGEIAFGIGVVKFFCNSELCMLKPKNKEPDVVHYIEVPPCCAERIGFELTFIKSQL